MDYPLKRLLVITIACLCITSNIAVAGYICDEAIVPKDMTWEHPNLPVAAASQLSSSKFCNSNPHSFQTTSASLSPHRTPMICYNSEKGVLVVELPNQLFSRCKSDDELNRVLGRYAFHAAKIEKKPFSLIVYNEKHYFYRKGDYAKNDSIFEKVLDWEYFQKRNQYIVQQRKAGIYPIETITCTATEETLHGDPCPSDLLENYPLKRPR